VYKILSRDGEHEFKIASWVMRAFNYVNLSQHKWAYMQKADTGSGGRAKSGRFQGYYYYKSVLNLSFNTNFYNYEHAEIDEIPVFVTEPTYCNHSVSVFLKELGLRALSDLFKNEDANTIINMLQTGAIPKAVEIIRPKGMVGLSHTALTLAAQCVYEGIGHIAPVIGMSAAGETYVANIGALKRDGVVNAEYAFAAPISEISFYELSL